MQKLLNESANSKFDFGAFLADAEVRRVDAAIDYAGVKPGDLIVTADDEGKRISYNGSDGELETLQVHRFKKVGQEGKKLLNPAGPLIAKIYDRNRERLARGKPVPYPGFQITRVEALKLRFKSGFGLLDLPFMPSMFANIRVSYADALAGDLVLKPWRIYCGLRHAFGHTQAVNYMGKSPLYFPTMKRRYEAHPSNLLPQDAWDGWQDGISKTGLGYLVILAHAANEKSKEEAAKWAL